MVLHMTSVKLKLTDSLIKQVPEDISRINDTDVAGFYAQIGKRSDHDTRSCTFYLYYRFGGRDGIQRRYSIGKACSLTAINASAYFAHSGQRFPHKSSNYLGNNA